MTQRFAGGDVPRPPWWGGFRVRPAEMEFWQGAAATACTTGSATAVGAGGDRLGVDPERLAVRP